MNQETALQYLYSGKNVFLTGSAGAGKTWVLNAFIRYLRMHNIPVAVTASTGIAATHLNGQTVHSWTGIGIKDHLSPADLKKIASRGNIKRSLEKTEVLIIDEISMLHRRQFELCDVVLRFIRNNDLPFGGVQLVVCGDFFQLPPVADRMEENRERYAFMSPTWVAANPVICYLNTQYRQKEEKGLNQILNALRSGNCGVDEIAVLESTKVKEWTDSTHLYTHNMDVDAYNFRKLKDLPGEEIHFQSKTKGRQKMVDQLKRSVLAPERLGLKIGARVMFVKNNYEQGYMNGTLGTIKGFEEEEGWPVVLTDRDKEIIAEEQVWMVEDEKGQSMASYIQIPLRLAWAITIHKSQGMTLDSAVVDLSKTFETGQGYVALSRLRDLDGLKLNGLNLMALNSDDLVRRADKRFAELSQLAVLNFLEMEGKMLENKEAREKKYVRNHGIRHTRQEKLSTYEHTLKYVHLKWHPEKIAKERGLSGSTVLNHILHLKRQGTPMDLEYLKPKGPGLTEILQAMAQLRALGNPDDFSTKTRGELKLASIVTALAHKYSYEDVRMAMLFEADDIVLQGA